MGGGHVDDLPYLGDLKDNRLRARAGSLVVAQPVFTPVAWVMFAESQYGVRIKDIVRERAKQLLDVQVAALFYHLDYVKSEFGFHYTAHTFGVGKRERHIGKFRHPSCTSCIAQLTAIAGRAILTIQTGQRLERRLTFVDAVGKLA